MPSRRSRISSNNPHGLLARTSHSVIACCPPMGMGLYKEKHHDVFFCWRGSGVWPNPHWRLSARLRVWLPVLASFTVVKWAYEMHATLSRSGDSCLSSPRPNLSHIDGGTLGDHSHFRISRTFQPCVKTGEKGVCFSDAPKALLSVSQGPRTAFGGDSRMKAAEFASFLSTTTLAWIFA